MINLLQTAYLGSAQANKNVAAGLDAINAHIARLTAKEAIAAAAQAMPMADRRPLLDGSAP